MRTSTSTARKNNWRRSITLKRGLAGVRSGAASTVGGGAYEVSGQSGNKGAVSDSAGIRLPFGRGLGAFDGEGVSIHHDPLDGLALLQLESFGERSGTDQIELAGMVGAFDELDLREEAHNGALYY